MARDPLEFSGWDCRIKISPEYLIFEFLRPDSKLVNKCSFDAPMACTVELDLVTFSQFKVSLTKPLSRSRICRPEKSVAPAAASSGDKARSESTAVNWVKTVDFRLKDQSKDVILLPWATCREP
ncbi:DNA gyrase subunit B [Striga asiatica]|uniref:DNA gyrase subunit B n=1 Tax=Striga asiatica TaxID=4170 RepID=A0A5A7PCE8_STRAF|nr:DNA gyrase subunit B [Striga asiatica]